MTLAPLGIRYPPQMISFVALCAKPTQAIVSHPVSQTITTTLTPSADRPPPERLQHERLRLRQHLLVRHRRRALAAYHRLELGLHARLRLGVQRGGHDGDGDRGGAGVGARAEHGAREVRHLVRGELELRLALDEVFAEGGRQLVAAVLVGYGLASVG
jgi:hypothetical protein